MFVNPQYYMGPTPTNPLSVGVWLRFVALLTVLLYLMLAGTTVCRSSVDTLSHGQDESEGYTHGGLVRQVISLSQSQSHPNRHRYFRALFHAGPARPGLKTEGPSRLLLPDCPLARTGRMALELMMGALSTGQPGLSRHCPLSRMEDEP